MTQKDIETELKKESIPFVPNSLPRIRERMEYQKAEAKKPTFLKKKLVLVFSSFLLFLLLCSSFFLYMGSEKERLYIDVNPSVELVVNHFNRVTKVNCLNDDAISLFSNKEYLGLSEDKVVEDIAKTLVDSTYLEEDGAVVSITGYCKNNKAYSEKKLAKLTAIIQNQCKNGKCSNDVDVVGNNLSKEEKETIASEDISVGKYKLIQKIRELDSSFSYDELKTWAVKDLQKLYKSLK